MEIQKASRKKVKLKLNISGVSGSGKTMGALLLAKGLVGDLSKVVVIDSENSSASLYEHIGEFSTLDLTAPYSPERYNEAINLAVKNGFECVIIDSVSHEWAGSGGVCEINENLANLKYKGNSWSAWNESTPRHQKFIDTILQSNIHVITCCRSKMETVMGEGKKVHKVGMKDIQREGWEYELSVSFQIDRDNHRVIVQKDRTELFKEDGFILSEEIGIQLREWCEKGVNYVKPLQKLPTNLLEKAVDKIKNNEPNVIENLQKYYLISETDLEVLNATIKLNTDNAE